MNPKLNRFLCLGEEQYLQSGEVQDYQAYLSQLGEKVKVYERIRDKEVFLFKILASEVQERYPEERSSLISEALTQWSLILKTCCTAMLLDNTEYLEARAENWLKAWLQNRDIPQIDELIYNNLLEILPEVLMDGEVSCLKPYLERMWHLIGMQSESQTLFAMS